MLSDLLCLRLLGKLTAATFVMGLLLYQLHRWLNSLTYPPQEADGVDT